ncbi:MAG: Kazal-type serine protease inhibitor domain-containing protein [Nannocystales bacterium]
MLVGLSFALGLSVATNADPVELDRRRITAHLKQTEAVLRARDVSSLSPALQRNRVAGLDALHRYWVRGVYPVNALTHGLRTPIFIDHGGRACAVGQIMLETGASELAQRVAQRERVEYLATIDTEGVARWIGASGFSFAELARIQPSYCNCEDQPLEPVCGVDGETYPNACLAVDCAGVEIDVDGPCEGNGESGDGETDGATGEATSSPEDTTAESSEPEDEDPSGCRVGSRGAGSALVLLCLCSYRRRRR